MQIRIKAKDLHLKTISPGEDAPFSRSEYADRLNRVREEMSKKNIDLLYLSSPESIYYLSGYMSEWYQSQSPKGWVPASGIAVEVDHDNFIFFDNGFEEALIKRTTISSDTRTYERARAKGDRSTGPLQWVTNELKEEGWLPGTVGLEFWSYRPNRAVSEIFQKELENAGGKVVDGSDVVRDVRAIKSPQELAYIKKAAEIADTGMNAAIDYMKPGVTELDVYGEIIHAMAKAGGENPAIPVLVRASGAGHNLASRREIKEGDIVTIDMCGVYNLYHANICRNFSIGKPHTEIEKAFEVTAKAFDVVEEMLKPNLPVADLNKMMRSYYEKERFEEYLSWSGGYEFGIGFPPDWVGWFVYSCIPAIDPGDRLFVPGTVVNHECLFYLPLGVSAAWLINTIIFDQKRAGFLSEIPNDLIVV